MCVCFFPLLIFPPLCLRPILSLSTVGQRLMESLKFARQRKSLNTTGACFYRLCLFFLSVSTPSLTGFAYVWLFFRFAFLFDKAMFVCKKKSGETFELKEIIELQCYQIRDEPLGEKDNKKVFHRCEVHLLHVLDSDVANRVCICA